MIRAASGYAVAPAAEDDGSKLISNGTAGPCKGHDPDHSTSVLSITRLIRLLRHPADRMFRDSMLLLIGTQVANVFSLIFQVAMMRMLLPAEYAVVTAMLGVFMTVFIPMGALMGTAAHFAARFVKSNESHKVKPMVLRVCRHLLVPCVAICLVTVLARRPLVAFFRLDSFAPIAVTAVSCCLAMYIPLFIGSLHGFQAFIKASLVRMALSGIRLTVGVGAAALGGTAAWILGAHALGACASSIVGIIALAGFCGTWRGNAPRIDGFYPYFLRHMIASVGYAVLMNADVIMAKHYFPADQAGLFARVAMIGRIIIFLPMPVALAMFPKVVSSGEADRGTGVTLLKAVIMVGVLVGGVALFCSLWPGLILRLFTGSQSSEMIPVLRILVWGLCPLSIAFVIMNYEVAQRRFKVAVPLVLCAALYVSGVTVWHQSFIQIVGVLAAASTMAATLCAACLPWRSLLSRES